MRKVPAFFPLLSFVLIGACDTGGPAARSYPPSQADALLACVSQYTAGLDSLDQALALLGALPPLPDSARAQRVFRNARRAYKRVEHLIEFEDRNFEDRIWVRTLNSPPIPTVNEDDNTDVVPPSGFQVIEASTFPRPTDDFERVVRREVASMRQMVKFVRNDSSTRAAWTWEVPYEAARRGLARITTLGIAGFDATVSGDGILESAEALRGIQAGLLCYKPAMLRRDSSGWEALQRSLEAGILALQTTPDFTRFDRLDFQVRYARPIADRLSQLRRSLALRESSVPDPWSPGATDIYAADAIDPGWFAPDYAPSPTHELVALGRELFFDPRLSGSQRRSCGTCHQPGMAFTDGRKVAAVDSGHGAIRNTPTLLNAGLQGAQFADRRVHFLEFQFEDVMANPREMALHADSAARRLWSDSALTLRFAAAFRAPREQALTGRTLSIAVAAYVRSLQALNSRFDRAVRGDIGAITPSERQGFNLFMGKAQCGTCHFAPLFGGAVPPDYLETEAEVIGVPGRPRMRAAVVDPDPGVFAVSGARLHRHAFKTPSVRNVELTAPYMHNGVFRALDEVVDFYDRGGGNGIGMNLPNQTLSSEPLELSDQEKRDLVSFMRALTDSSAIRAERLVYGRR